MLSWAGHSFLPPNKNERQRAIDIKDDGATPTARFVRPSSRSPDLVANRYFIFKLTVMAWQLQRSCSDESFRGSKQVYPPHFGFEQQICSSSDLKASTTSLNSETGKIFPLVEMHRFIDRPRSAFVFFISSSASAERSSSSSFSVSCPQCAAVLTPCLRRTRQ